MLQGRSGVSVGNCPNLFYVDLSLPIHVRTNASDYRIGGYIFQLDQQQELPIWFINKALHKAQLNWSTFEKEAYATFYTITKFDFYLETYSSWLKQTIRT
jgi:hypothetical protein